MLANSVADRPGPVPRPPPARGAARATTEQQEARDAGVTGLRGGFRVGGMPVEKLLARVVALGVAQVVAAATSLRVDGDVAVLVHLAQRPHMPRSFRASARTFIGAALALRQRGSPPTEPHDDA